MGDGGAAVNQLPIVEIFGPTIQGEGPASGQLSSFIRLGGCNLACTWCDSAYTWDASRFDLREQIANMEVSTIMGRLPAAPVCVVTGGEPLLYQDRDAFRALLGHIRARGAQVHIETNGTIVPSREVQDLVDTFVVSPKLGHAEAQKGRVSPALADGWGNIASSHSDAHLKVVVKTRGDVFRAAEMAVSSGWDRRRVWVMPEGVDTETLDQRWPDVCAWAIEAGVNVTHRLHVLAWGEERGH